MAGVTRKSPRGVRGHPTGEKGGHGPPYLRNDGENGGRGVGYVCDGGINTCLMWRW